MAKTYKILAQHLEKIPMFLTVGRQGSFQNAALHLRLSQPAVSKSVKILEEALGTQLFERGAHGVTLTSDGKVLFEAGERLLEVAETAERTICEDDSQGIVGELRVACHDFIASYLWPPTVERG